LNYSTEVVIQLSCKLDVVVVANAMMALRLRGSGSAAQRLCRRRAQVFWTCRKAAAIQSVSDLVRRSETLDWYGNCRQVAELAAHRMAKPRN